jgi:hypothetical protein
MLWTSHTLDLIQHIELKTPNPRSSSYCRNIHSIIRHLQIIRKLCNHAKNFISKQCTKNLQGASHNKITAEEITYYSRVFHSIYRITHQIKQAQRMVKMWNHVKLALAMRRATELLTPNHWPCSSWSRPSAHWVTFPDYQEPLLLYMVYMTSWILLRGDQHITLTIDIGFWIPMCRYKFIINNHFVSFLLLLWNVGEYLVAIRLTLWIKLRSIGIVLDLKVFAAMIQDFGDASGLRTNMDKCLANLIRCSSTNDTGSSCTILRVINIVCEKT